MGEHLTLTTTLKLIEIGGESPQVTFLNEATGRYQQYPVTREQIESLKGKLYQKFTVTTKFEPWVNVFEVEAGK